MQILIDVFESKLGFVNQVLISIAVPTQFVDCSLRAREFNNQTERSLGPLRTVRNQSRQQPHLSFADHNIVRIAAIERTNSNGNIALQLIKQFLGFVDVIIIACVGPFRDKHDHVVGFFVELLVHHGFLELVIVISDPLHQVKRLGRHGYTFVAGFSWEDFKAKFEASFWRR